MSPGFAADVLLFNGIGQPFSGETIRRIGIGGSELEVVQVAEALAARGHDVVVAAGIDEEVTVEGVRHVPAEWLATSPRRRFKALYVERWSELPRVFAERTVIRATDVCTPPYDVHNGILGRREAALACVSQWQARGFVFAKVKHILPPMLGAFPGTVDKDPNLFVYASSPAKGWEPTRQEWHALKKIAKREGGDVGRFAKGARLAVVFPGRSFQDAPELGPEDLDAGIEMVGVVTSEDYRREIAKAAALFYVGGFQETFGCCAAFAEKFGGRAHVLCYGGKCGLSEALANGGQFLTTDRETFEADVLEAFVDPPPPVAVEDRSPEALAPFWEKALGLPAGA